MPDPITSLIDQLRRDEGERLRMYLDSKGIPTIGIGHNLRDKPISRRASRVIFEDDMEDVRQGLYQALPWTATMDEVRREVLQNMAFNLGVAGLLEFKRTLAHAERGEWHNAAGEMLQSDWARQVGDRAQRLARQMELGVRI